MKKYDTLLFDFDGTLIDSIGDLNMACNHVLENYGFPKRSVEETRTFIGNGLRVLVYKSLPESKKDILDEVYPIFRNYYFKNCCVKTKPYDGIISMLEHFKKAGLKMAVITNKPDTAAKEITDCFLSSYITHVFGEREGVKRKPDSQMVFMALDELKSSTEKAVYIGDSEVDILTAENSGLNCISVDWGFRSHEELVKSGAKTIMSSPKELEDYILK
jgi:phosphoglycolate phosphatase